MSFESSDRPSDSRPTSSDKRRNSQLTLDQQPTRVRWLIFVLACGTSWFLYLHRYTWNFIRPELEKEFGLTNTQLEAKVLDRTDKLRMSNVQLRNEIIERKQAEEEIQKSHRQQSVLNTLLRISMKSISLKEQLEQALDEIVSTPWLPVVPRGGIFLVGEEEGMLELQVQRDLDPPLSAAARPPLAPASGAAGAGIPFPCTSFRDGFQVWTRQCLPYAGG